MTTAITVSVISGIIVLFITLFVKDYISKSKEANVHKHLIESIDRLRENLKEEREENHKLNKEITELKNEVEFLKDKNDKQEEYIFTLRAHIDAKNPPPPPEKKWGITKDGKIVDIN